MLLNYDKVEYYNLNNELIYQANIIYSRNLKNDFLSMMLGEFADNKEVSPISDKIGGDYDNEALEVLSQLAAFQNGSLESMNRYEYYSLVDSMRVLALRAPNECSKIKIIDSKTDEFDELDLVDGDYMVNEFNSVEKLILIISSPQVIDNISPKIHEHSYSPHGHLYKKVLTRSSFNEISSIPEIIDLFDNIGGVKIGDSVESVITDNDQPVVVGSLSELSLLFN